MNPELQAFARQLETWTGLVIENGRTPFRRVDLFPTVHTAQGILQPPLIFWINRQSMMAGGVLLLPDQDLAAELQRGRSVAEALGLRHFVTWETDQLRIWELQATSIEVHQQFAFPGSDDPDAYRRLLSKLLESLKLLAVLGLVPPAELSADYLHNLFQTTLELALPPLVNSFRRQRAQETSQPATDADQAAREAARLTLLQLLTLLWHQQLPGSILPEKLERAIELSLSNLPEHLQQPFGQKVFQDQPDLPYDTAVCFHHLLLRLRQIGWNQPQQRARQALENLIGSWYPASGQCDQAQICLYPQMPRLASNCQLIVSDSALLLAASALLDDLSQQPAREQVFGTLFNLELPAETNTLRIAGQLSNQSSPSREKRQQFGTLLRNSWPNRRFRLPSGAPLWLWETLHLLGLCKNGCELSLKLPLLALQTAADGPLWTVLTEAYSLQTVRLLANAQLHLELCELSASAPLICIETATGSRNLSPADSPAVVRSQILLALQMPDEIYRLLDHELNWSAQPSTDAPEPSDLLLFSRSRLGQGLWELLSAEPMPDSASALAEAANRLGWPKPTPGLLRKLTARVQDPAAPAADLDQSLAELLGVPAVADFRLHSGTPQKQTFSRGQMSDKELREELIQQLQAEGIPTFPDQYLYFLEAPQMLRYQLQPPLEIVSEFLGQIELRDALGQLLQVYGEEQAEALLLCAELQKTEVELPADRHQVSLLLDHYRQDLKQLHQHLNSLCYSRQENALIARKLVRKVWKKLHVPSLKWLKD